MIRKLLIANRGEIALRVMRTARQMGIRTVAVYSCADAKALHPKFADERVPLVGPEPSSGYLDIDEILRAARETGAEAIHPGYGFLSERAEFAAACEANGIRFVGPSAAAMRRLGAKIEAKELAIRAGVPVVPGYFKGGASSEELRSAALEIGFPVLLKASAGGGGRGMRVVRAAEDFDSQLDVASEEALKAFGDGSMMVEKLVERPRHVEVQVLADQHGTIACLFERECSIQRRHQKLIEEAPSPLWSETSGQWDAMRDAARALVREAGYVGAGTVEFIVDPTSGEFYFLEVNARLQVEHPVTEGITGLDLVRWQLEIASGAPLAISPGLVEGYRAAIRGHVIEARIVAEDPAKGFLPSVGGIVHWAEPKGPGIRVDSGYEQGSEVSQYYDSLVAKVIAQGEDRPQAIQRLKGALLDFHILGVRTNIAYLLDVLSHPQFVAGSYDTGFLEREMTPWSPGPPPRELGLLEGQAAGDPAASLASRSRALSVWDIADGFRIPK